MTDTTSTLVSPTLVRDATGEGGTARTAGRIVDNRVEAPAETRGEGPDGRTDRTDARREVH